MLHYTNGNSLLIFADTNARSKLWYNVISNELGKMLEEFITHMEAVNCDELL